MITNSNIQAEASAIMLQAVQAITGSNNHQQEEREPEVYNMTSNLFPCICVAMYETILSPIVFEDSMNEGEEPYYYDTVDFDDWKVELTKVAQDYLDHNVIEGLRKYGLLNIEACSIWSPAYYNFHQDELVMDVTMASDWQATMKAQIELWKGREDVEKYIRQNWRSCSGYVNFMPESLEEVLTEQDEERQLAAYLTLAMLVEGSLRHYEDILEDLYYAMNDSFQDWHSVNVIEEYMDEAEAEKLLDLYNNDDQWNDLYWTLAEKIGFRWLHEGSGYLRGKKDSGYQFNAKSDGEKLLFWAVENDLTVNKLYELAA